MTPEVDFTKPTREDWIIGLAREIFVSRMVNSTNATPAKSAIEYAEELTGELLKKGYHPFGGTDAERASILRELVSPGHALTSTKGMKAA